MRRPDSPGCAIRRRTYEVLIDPKTIVVIGHSMGGFDTVMLSGDKQVAGSVVISGADIGGRLAEAAGKPIAALREDWGDDASYTNMTLEEMVADGAANAAVGLAPNAAQLAGRPLLLLSSNDGLKPDADIAARRSEEGGRHGHRDQDGDRPQL